MATFQDYEFLYHGANTTNSTGICDPHVLTKYNWTIDNPFTMFVSAVVMVYFGCQWYLNRKAGPSLWDSPWMPIFYGYVLMQFCALFLFGGFMQFYKVWPIFNPISVGGIILRIAFVGLDWGGYWLVGQYMIVAPLVDMGFVSWKKKGWFRILNYVITFTYLIWLTYMEFTVASPFTNKWVHKAFDFSRTMVYLGNIMLLVEVIQKGWLCNLSGFLVLLDTAINLVGLYLFFGGSGNSSGHNNSQTCTYYVLEGAATLVLWFFVLNTRSAIDLDCEADGNSPAVDETFLHDGDDQQTFDREYPAPPQSYMYNPNQNFIPRPDQNYQILNEQSSNNISNYPSINAPRSTMAMI